MIYKFSKIYDFGSILKSRQAKLSQAKSREQEACTGVPSQLQQLEEDVWSVYGSEGMMDPFAEPYPLKYVVMNNKFKRELYNE